MTTMTIDMPPGEHDAPPSRLLMMLEVRAVAELGAFFSSALLLRLAPRGDGHPVLVLPGLAASDLSTQAMRAFLRDRGYRSHGWRLGLNRGPRAGVERAIEARLNELHQRYQRKVSVIGWSLGGLYARELARRMPGQVRSVITMGSPFGGGPHSNNVWRLYEELSGMKAVDWPDRERMKSPPPVPATAIFSRSDGIVAWQSCLERESASTENIEVMGSHCGLGHNPTVLYAVADRLALPEGQWQRFERSGPRALLYPDPQRKPAG